MLSFALEAFGFFEVLDLFSRSVPFSVPTLSSEDNASAPWPSAFDPSALVDALQGLQNTVASQGAGLVALTSRLDDAG